jgi:hypothetical protein
VRHDLIPRNLNSTLKMICERMVSLNAIDFVPLEVSYSLRKVSQPLHIGNIASQWYLVVSEQILNN